jgi:hypothetical protein
LGWGAAGESHRFPTIRIQQHIVVPEPQHAKSLAAQVRIARPVASSSVIPIVLTAIHLDHER